MKKYFRKYFLVWCIIIPLSGVSGQEVRDLHLDVGFGGGFALPRGDFSNTAKTGYHLSLSGYISTSGFLRVGAGVHYNNLRMEKEIQFAPFSEPSLVHDNLGYWMFSAGLALVPVRSRPAPYIDIDALFNLLESTPSFESETSHTGLGIGGGILVPFPQPITLDIHAQYQILNLLDKGSGGLTMPQLVVEASLFFTVF